jgi:hypothetical protein
MSIYNGFGGAYNGQQNQQGTAQSSSSSYNQQSQYYQQSQSQYYQRLYGVNIFNTPTIIFEPIYPIMAKHRSGKELFLWIP